MATWDRVREHEGKGHRTGYSDEYDAYFCATCRKWLERRCLDPLCEYCRRRPFRPPERGSDEGW